MNSQNHISNNIKSTSKQTIFSNKERLSNFVRTQRTSTMLRPSDLNFEINEGDLDFTNTTINIPLYEKKEKNLYGATAKEISSEFTRVYDDVTKYLNYLLYSKMRSIYEEKEEFNENIFDEEMNTVFEHISPKVETKLDYLERELGKNLSLKEFNETLTDVILSGVYNNNYDENISIDENIKTNLIPIKTKLDNNTKDDLNFKTTQNYLDKTDIIKEKFLNEANENSKLLSEISNLELKISAKRKNRQEAEKYINILIKETGNKDIMMNEEQNISSIDYSKLKKSLDKICK